MHIWLSQRQKAMELTVRSTLRYTKKKCREICHESQPRMSNASERIMLVLFSWLDHSKATKDPCCSCDPHIKRGLIVHSPFIFTHHHCLVLLEFITRPSTQSS
ncbi:uncharacterized protein FOMMEDRAFT_20058 [Fomitiporia mediterranea MF3/22]|uniref:uncharacterized protein n=1 Tax=Fomitiporia mediterranea (strain MF3/22) TaxID=694068 RepID=UPI00044098BB|nr:uncharacterized protein FOMMEDRAFT_20058 [Fomitiporia mediterranea MF3/22]EJD02814.1 hypothetical protein FOMMEDRAFT_20058 [Fomitiporia mediterranea MF3/22]